MPLPDTVSVSDFSSTQRGMTPELAAEQDEVLRKLRTGWVGDYESNPTKARRKPAKRGPGMGAILNEASASVKAGIRDLPRAVLTMAREAAELFLGRNVAAMLGGGGVILLLGGVVAVGALAYAASVGHMFGALSQASDGDADPGKPDPPAVSVEMTQAAPVAAAKTRDDGASADTITLGSQSGGLAPNWNGGALAASAPAPPQEADDASPPAHDVAADVVSASEQHADEVARVAIKAPSEHLSSGAPHQSAGAEQSAHGSSPVAMADRGQFGGGGSGQSTSLPSAGAQAAAAVTSQHFQADAGVPVRETAVDQEKVEALERAQVLAATGASHADVERTALEAIGHGGQALFEVQHVDSRTGAVHPARIVLRTTSISLIPETAGDTKAFSVPLRSVRVAGNASDASVMDIEFSVGGKKGQIGLRYASAQAAAMLTHIRNVIRALQQG